MSTILSAWTNTSVRNETKQHTEKNKKQKAQTNIQKRVLYLSDCTKKITSVLTSRPATIHTERIHPESTNKCQWVLQQTSIHETKVENNAVI